MTVQSMEIRRQGAGLGHRHSRARRGADVDCDGGGSQTVCGPDDPTPGGGAHVHTPGGQVCRARLGRHVVQALKPGDVPGLSDALEAALTSLACQAQRTHPARERQTGRAQWGLAPLLRSDEVNACAETA
jgi:hypothetical protein